MISRIDGFYRVLWNSRGVGTWRLLGDYLVGGALGVNKIQIEKKGRGSLCRGLVLDGEGLGVLAQVWAGKSV